MRQRHRLIRETERGREKGPRRREETTQLLHGRQPLVVLTSTFLSLELRSLPFIH
jgi:hypothetical protein